MTISWRRKSFCLGGKDIFSCKRLHQDWVFYNYFLFCFPNFLVEFIYFTISLKTFFKNMESFLKIWTNAYKGCYCVIDFNFIKMCIFVYVPNILSFSQSFISIHYLRFYVFFSYLIAAQFLVNLYKYTSWWWGGNVHLIKLC